MSVDHYALARRVRRRLRFTLVMLVVSLSWLVFATITAAPTWLVVWWCLTVLLFTFLSWATARHLSDAIERHALSSSSTSGSPSTAATTTERSSPPAVAENERGSVLSV